EDRTLPAGSDRTGQDGGRVVDRPLERVGLLAPGELEDDGPDAARLGRLVDRPRQVEGLGAEIDRRDRESADLATAARLVKRLDARRMGSEDLARLPDEPLGGLRGGHVVAERGGPRQRPDRVTAECGLVLDDQALAVEPRAWGDRIQQCGG